jgi:ATP-dependent DNA helicase RecQ
MPTTETTTGPTPCASTAETRARAEQVLQAIAGPAAQLHEDQWAAVVALVLGRRRALVVQRTGWGKSAVYFVATALLRERGSGPTVIVSPLLALMRNQISAAERAGIRARTINSANLEEWQTITAEVARGKVDLLLVSPERLNNPDFRDTVLPHLAATAGLLVVDEAHCISDWGHDFRPDYRRLRTLLATLRSDVPVLATTATANARVVADVAEQLSGGRGRDANGAGNRAEGDTATDGTVVLRGSLDRASLRLGVVSLPSGAHRLAWLADHLAGLPGSGIVYTLTVAAADEVAAFLRSRGHPVASYTGRTEDADRRAAEDSLLGNEIKALVATSALGMGFDKPDLGFVVHLGAPQSPIAYYQQVGRAGRGVERADVLLLPGPEDEAIWSYFAGLAFPAEEHVRAALAVLDASDRPVSTAALESRVDLARNRLEQMLKVLDVDGAVRRVRGGWVATGQPWAYDRERYARVAATRAQEQQAMRDYLVTDGCRMEFLRRQLDDPQAAPCGRCDRCAGPFISADVADETLATARGELARPGVELAPRVMWPTGLPAVGVGLSGRIGADERAEPGRAVGRLSDIGWGPRLRALLGEEAPDGPVPADVVDAVVAVLAAWSWEYRPAGVLTVASRSRPQLVGSLGARIAEIGRLPLLGSVERHGGEGASRVNSAQRVRALHAAFVVPDQLAARLADLGEAPVLLVDDLSDTGWTMALAVRALRRAGAARVLPLVLALGG